MNQPQKPNYEYLVNSSGQKIAEMIPVPMEFVAEVEDLLIVRGCKHIEYRREMRPKGRE